MLEIRKAAISLDEAEVLELERVITDRDEKEAMAFLKRCVYDRILHAQQGRLKSHLDTGDNPVDGFIKGNR
ncbi:MAG TPA: hypothetical protein VGA82_04945 [Dehalococcoidales bacterium]